MWRERADEEILKFSRHALRAWGWLWWRVCRVNLMCVQVFLTCRNDLRCPQLNRLKIKYLLYPRRWQALTRAIRYNYPLALWAGPNYGHRANTASSFLPPTSQAHVIIRFTSLRLLSPQAWLNNLMDNGLTQHGQYAPFHVGSSMKTTKIIYWMLSLCLFCVV